MSAANPTPAQPRLPGLPRSLRPGGDNPGPPPVTPEQSDARQPRRIRVALLVSVVLNALVWIPAGFMAHHFLQGIKPKPERIYVTRVVLPAADTNVNSQTNRARIAAQLAKAKWLPETPIPAAAAPPGPASPSPETRH